MAYKSSTHNYGTIARFIHWTTAILILALLGSGFVAADTMPAVEKAEILRIHVPMGLAILLITLVRIAWWVFADKKPEPLPMAKWQMNASKLVHLLFYLVIIGMVTSGVGMMVLSGAREILFTDNIAALPDFTKFLPRVPHGLGARLMVALIGLHVGAALFHHFIKRDNLMARMWPGKSGQ